MNSQPEMLDFIKAISDVERLRVIGVLTRGPFTPAQVAETLGIQFRDAIDHLVFLSHVGIVQIHSAEQKQDDTYELDDSGLEALSRQQFKGQRDAYIPAPNLNENVRKILATYLNADGSIKQIPSQTAKLRVILEYLVSVFAPGANYSEKEVNTILRRFHLDVSGLRRYLIDSGLMARESNGSRYWRVS